MPVPRLRGLWRCARRRVGRRGAFLLAMAVLDTGQAARLTWPSGTTLASPPIQFLAGVAPLPLWGALWCLVGVLCLAQAFQLRDRAAYSAAAALKVAWAAAHVGAWAAGVAQAWWSVIIWLVIAGVVHLIATWPETDTPGGEFDDGPGTAGDSGAMGT